MDRISGKRTIFRGKQEIVRIRGLFVKRLSKPHKIGYSTDKRYLPRHSEPEKAEKTDVEVGKGEIQWKRSI